MAREDILRELKKLQQLDPDALKKPIIMKMGETNHNIVTGEDLLKTLSGEQLSFGNPTPNPGGVTSKDKFLNKLNNAIR